MDFASLSNLAADYAEGPTCPLHLFNRDSRIVDTEHRAMMLRKLQALIIEAQMFGPKGRVERDELRKLHRFIFSAPLNTCLDFGLSISDNGEVIAVPSAALSA
jgi:hypothetical protein